jgi:hypothetical protein
MTLILLNKDGASEETRNLESRQEVVEQIETWSDPENLTAKIYDHGELIFEGIASEYQ